MVFVIVVPANIYADTVTVGSDSISVSIPKGYCNLNPNNLSDVRLIDYLKDANRNNNKVLVVFADCEQLKLWRAGSYSSLDEYGYILAPLSMINKKTKMSISNYLGLIEGVLKESNAKILNKAVGKTRVVLGRHFKLAKLNKVTTLGLFSIDDNALYTGMLAYTNNESGESKFMVGITSMTLVNGKAINLYLWKKHISKRTVYELETLSTSWVRGVQKSN